MTDRLRSMRPGRPWNPLPSSRAARASRLERDAARLLNGPRSPSEAPSRAFVVSAHSGPPSRLITSQGRSAGLQRALSACSRLACRLPRGYPPSSPASSVAVVPVRTTWSSCRVTIWYQSGADQVVISHRGRAGGKTPPGRVSESEIRSADDGALVPERRRRSLDCLRGGPVLSLGVLQGRSLMEVVVLFTDCRICLVHGWLI